MFDRSTYEVQTLLNDHWILDQEFKREKAAMEHAKGLLESQMADGVKVVRIWQRSDGDETEKVLFQEILQGKGKIIRIVPVEEAPVCQDLADYYKLPARQTIGRLMREYLEDQGLLPFDVLHAYRPLKRFMDNDLYPSAVDRISTIHAKLKDEDSKKTRDDLYRIVDEIAMRSTHAEGTKAIRKCESDDINVIAKAAKEGSFDRGEDIDYLIRAAMAIRTSIINNFMGKMEWGLDALHAAEQAQSKQACDALIADLIDTPQLIQDMLGAQVNLKAALLTLLDLMRGKSCETKYGASQETMDALAKGFADGLLPEAKQAGLDFITRQVASKAPLSRNEPTAEADAYTEILVSVLTPRGIIGGSAMAEALTMRYSRRLEKGGRTGETQAIDGVSEMIRQGLHLARYFLALPDTNLGQRHIETISTRLETLAKDAKGVDHFSLEGFGTKEKLLAMKELQVSALKSKHIPQEVSRSFVTALDNLVAEYLVKARVIEMMDNPNEPLRVRAVRLVKFCGSGIILDKSKAMGIARDRVVTYLKQPNFIETFTEGIGDPKKIEETVKGFYGLLAKSGFQQ